MRRTNIGYRLYRGWFNSNLVMLVMALMMFIYFRFFAEATWLIIPSFMFVLMCFGWGATALAGMKSCRSIKDSDGTEDEITHPYIISINNVTIKYRFKNRESDPKLINFAIFDILQYSPDAMILEINEVYVEPELRGHGFGCDGLREFCELYPSHLILLNAGFLKREYPNLKEDRHNILAGLNTFYNKAGFVCVNAYIGAYENHRTYIYANDVCGEFVDTVCNGGRRNG
jgi:GNAT superfamily N-acetyltransferase